MFGLCVPRGARHGLKLSGKLARVQEQERLLLEQYRQAGTPLGPALPRPTGTAQGPRNGGAEPDLPSSARSGVGDGGTEPGVPSSARSGVGDRPRSEESKKKKKSKKRKREEAADGDSDDRPERNGDDTQRKSDSERNCDGGGNVSGIISSKKKKRRKEKPVEDADKVCPGTEAGAVIQDVEDLASSRKTGKRKPGTEAAQDGIEVGTAVSRRSVADSGLGAVSLQKAVKGGADRATSQPTVLDSDSEEAACRKSKKKKKKKKKKMVD